MSTMPRYYAIVPACGESRRMGTDKLTLPWHGSTIIQTVISAWQHSPIDVIGVVVPKSRADLQKLLKGTGVEIIPAETRPADMRGTVQVGIDYFREHYAPNMNDAWLVAPADMPTLSSETISRVIRSYADHPGQIVLPIREEKRGHPALFPWELADLVAKLPRDRGLDALCEVRKPVEIRVDQLGQDANTPNELEKLREEFGG